MTSLKLPDGSTVAALPVRVGPHYTHDILDSNGCRFAQAEPAFTPMGEERARLIVLAVNAHGEMLKALRAVAGALDTEETYLALLQDVEAAIRKGEGRG